MLVLCGLLAIPAAAGAVEPTGSITGTVSEHTIAKNGIEGLCVTAISTTHQFGGEVQTGAGGKYEIKKLAAGKYNVSFHNCFEGTQLNYVASFWHEKTEETADPVEVTEGEKTTGINEEMRVGGEIEGKVLDGKGNPVANVCVDAISNKSGFFFFSVGFATTNAKGEYLIVGLATGSYTVGFFGCESANVVNAYYDTKEASSRTSSEANATPVVVTAEEEPVKPVQLNAVRLEAGGVIEGTITDSQGNAVTALLCVSAENPNGGNFEEFFAGFAVTTSGHYKIEGLATGTYRLKITQCSEEGKPVEWVTQYYNGVHNASEATPLAVTAGLEPPVAVTANVKLIRASAKKPVNSSTPVASGTASPGGILTCAPGNWSGTPAPTFAYQWLRDGIAVAGSTASTYTVQVTDEGHALSCIVTASNEAGSASSTSNQVQVPLPPTNPPTEIGSPAVNKHTGAITFKYEFPEPGSAALSGVVLHGASIARVTAGAAKHCRHGQVKRGRRCVSNGPVPYGSTQLNVSSAGIYTLTIMPSGKARAALRKGKSVSVTVTLTFTPAGTTDHIVMTKTVRVKLAHGKHKRK